MKYRCETKELAIGYGGAPLASGITLGAVPGQILALIGPTGAGKSTLSKLIYGFETPDAGEIILNGKPLAEENIRRRAQHIGYVMQNPNQMISKTMIFEEVALALQGSDMPQEQIRQRVEDTLKVCGLYPFRNWPISALSFGQKKRVTIASVLVQQPELIILDEPFNFLDPSSQSVIKHLLKKYNEEHNATVIISSHNLNHTVDVCPRIAVLEHGVIIRDLVNENNSAEKELEDYFNVEEE